MFTDIQLPIFDYCPASWVVWVFRYDYITDPHVLHPLVTDNKGVASVEYTRRRLILEFIRFCNTMEIS